MMVSTSPPAGSGHFAVLTAAGDRAARLVTAVGIELGVRVVQDGPALRMLHSITVTCVVHLAAPAGQKVEQSTF